ncbi:MAG: discoidin domain-containing protein [Elusimicrobiota bacterium]
MMRPHKTLAILIVLSALATAVSNAAVTVTASSEQAPEFQASYAADTDKGTRWSSEFADNQWIMFDLGKRQSAAGLIVLWEDAFAKEYKILVSDNKVNWKEVKDIKNAPGGEETVNFGKALKFRYCKLELIKRATGWGFSIYECRFLNDKEFKNELARNAPPKDMFAFPLPMDDSEPVFFDLSVLNHKPAGKHGRVTAGPDGHFYAGGKRIKFVGVDMTELPTKENAEKTAKHLAKYGVNVVRFHLMEWFIFDGRFGDTRHLRKDMLDTFDCFVAKLKENGIYSNVNLLCGRNFMPSDGLPESIKNIDWKEQGSIACIDKRMIELQKEYAKNLLDRVNPYTGLSYIEDPAIAFVEINNENGVIISWLRGYYDKLTEDFSADMKKEWNEYLLKKYKTAENLKKTWSINDPPGKELLANGDFSKGTENWYVEQHEGARIVNTVEKDGPGVKNASKIEVVKTGAYNWHIQFNQRSLELKKDAFYTLSFRAKADRNKTITVTVNQAYEPWEGMGFTQDIKLTKEWGKYEYIVAPVKSDSDARLSFFNMCSGTGTYWFADVSLKPGVNTDFAAADGLNRMMVGLIGFSDINKVVPRALNDWLSFLFQEERHYWGTMYKYLKDELKGKFLVCGTVVGCSTPNSMNELDYIDTHAYWMHPGFPNQAWSRTDWFVGNNALIDEPLGQPVSEVAVKRVYGKPFTVSEYDHPAPNVYAAEAYLLLGSYSAFQDWDGYYGFAYGDLTYDWIKSHFCLGQHTSKFMNFLAAACLFRRGDISPSGKTAYVDMSFADEMDIIKRYRYAWIVTDAEFKGMRRETSFLYKTCIVPEGGQAQKGWVKAEQAEIPVDGIYRSDTGEIEWDTKAGIFKVDTPMSKIIAGRVAGKKFDLDGISIKPGANKLNWCTFTMTAFETQDFKKPPMKILLTATGAVMNSGMKYKVYPDIPVDFPPPEDALVTLGADWGRSPVIAEGISAEIVLPYKKESVKVYALDNTGKRKQEVPVQKENDKSKIVISDKYKTLWYEIEVK